MRTFHIPMNLDFSRRKSCKGHNHNIYQKSPKFMVNVILCARPPNSMTSFTRKQYPNAVIGTIYPNAVTFHIPMNLYFSRRKSCKGHNHNIYQKSPKFMVNVILCARPPNSMTSFTRKQYPNAVIGAIYPNAVI